MFLWDPVLWIFFFSLSRSTEGEKNKLLFYQNADMGQGEYKLKEKEKRHLRMACAVIQRQHG